MKDIVDMEMEEEDYERMSETICEGCKHYARCVGDGGYDDLCIEEYLNEKIKEKKK